MIDNTIISISIIILASFVFILSMKGELFGGYNKKSILNDLNSSGIKFPKKFRVISCEDISKVWNINKLEFDCICKLNSPNKYYREMKKLYIDIDGVLLTIKNTQRPQYAVEFIDYITSTFDCYWLTSHCKEGDTKHLIQYLSPYYDAETIEKLKKIKPTSWVNAKVEAIDIHSDFYWLDDYVFQFEKEILEGFYVIDRLINVNLSNENELKHIKELLQSKQSDERKYLFLDLDGVLNTGQYSNYLEKNNLQQFDEDGAIFDPKAVENLQYIIDKTHAEIILTSTWRYDGLDKMLQLWKNRNLPSVLAGITPDLFPRGERRPKGLRGLEIYDWLNYGRGSDFGVFYTYAIVDDEDDFLEQQLEYLVLTDPMKGLTREVANKVISILNR